MGKTEHARAGSNFRDEKSPQKVFLHIKTLPMVHDYVSSVAVSVASCIIFRKQGNNNDKLNSAAGVGGGGVGEGVGGGETTLAQVILITILRR